MASSGGSRDAWRGGGGNGKGGSKGGGSKGGGKSGYSSGFGKGKSKGEGKDATSDGRAWDAAQLRSLQHSQQQPLDLARPRPQRRVEAFPHLTVAADWPEHRPPRSGSAFYLPLIWTALLPEPLNQGEQLSRGLEAALIQFQTLGDARHFHNGAANRSSLEDVWSAQIYWRMVFSGWDDWKVRLRRAIDNFTSPGGQRGLEALVAAHLQTLSVTACALVYGDLKILGALPHISNARRAPDQDAILELDFDVRMEMEASIQTLFVQGGEVIPATVLAELKTSKPTAEARKRMVDEVAASANVEGPAANDDAAQADIEERPSGGVDTDKEVMKLRKKLREIDKLKQLPAEELDVLQARKLEGEADLLARLEKLGAASSNADHVLLTS